VLDRRPIPTLAGYLTGATAARLGDELAAPALLLLALTATGTTTAGPVLVAALSGAAAVGGPFVGRWLDRSPRPGRLIGWFLLGCAAGLTAITLLLGHAPPAAVVGIGVATGLLRPVLSGGWSSQLHLVVHRRRLAKAAGLDALTFDLAAFAGPALAGLLALATGSLVAVLAAAGLMIIAVVPARTAIADPHREASRNVTSARIVAALHAIVRIRRLFRATAVSTVSYVGMGLLSTSLPLISRRVLGNADYAPLLIAMLAGAGLAANLVINLRRTPVDPDRLLLATVCLLVPGSALTALSVMIAGVAAVAALVIGVVIVGVADGPQLLAVLGIRHRDAPEALRAGIFTTGASIKICGWALGAGLSAALTGWSPRAALVTAAACQAAAVIIFLTLTARNR
jgi:MFS family permease